MPRKLPQKSREQKTDESQVHDRCQTPSYALDPILPYIPKDALIWEAACGAGQIVTALRDLNYNVVATDILTGHNFLSAPPRIHKIQFTNPPYSIKYLWLYRAYHIGTPFAFLVPVSTLGAAGCNSLIGKFGCEIMLLNKRVNFNMPNKGYSGKGAQFPVMWLCHNILPKPIMVGKIYPPKRSKVLLPEGVEQGELL